jgi:hypothetical protein
MFSPTCMTGLGLTVAVLTLSSVASTGPKEDVSAGTSEWGRALSEDDPDKVLPLYAADAVLWVRCPSRLLGAL